MIFVNEYCRRQFGQKLYKLSLNGGFTCPNRDGTVGRGGCVFCSEGGSGEFAPDACLPIDRQIELAKARVAAKFKGSRYIAYFQAFTNTYAPAPQLEALYMPVVQRSDIACLSIATRPDCLGSEVLAVLEKLSRQKPLWVELGLQTAKEETAERIHRGYSLPVYDEAVRHLNALGIHTVTHVILGLPGETRQDMLHTVRHAVEAGTGGVKLQLLHILKNTPLAEEYRAGRVSVMEYEEYLPLVCDCLTLLKPDTVVHRLTGDGPRKLLIAPLWTTDKKRVLNGLNAEMKHRGLA